MPQSLYVVRDSIYRCERLASVAEQVADQEPRTQFGRAMGQLGVELILTHSPQAKGRVERRHGLLQDRLVKEMRLVQRQLFFPAGKNNRRRTEAGGHLGSGKCEPISEGGLPAQVEPEIRGGGGRSSGRARTAATGSQRGVELGRRAGGAEGLDGSMGGPVVSDRRGSRGREESEPNRGKEIKGRTGTAIARGPPTEVEGVTREGELIRQLSGSIRRIEKAVLAGRSPQSSYERVKSLPGVGVILGLTIALESGDMKRFPSAGDFASYSRCVKSQRLSNGKSKGRNNARAGNRYLGWAWVEAANFARRFDPACRQFFDRKLAQTNRAVATKALACKLSNAAWHMAVHGTDYDPKRMFPGEPKA